MLKIPDDISDLHLLDELQGMENGTLVCWDTVDRTEKSEITTIIDKIRKHLALVFHRFLEGVNRKVLRIAINNNPIASFDPFDLNHPATQQLPI